MRRKNGITPEGVGIPKWALDDWRNNYVHRELWRPGEIRPGQELDPKKKRHGITKVESEPELCYAISWRVPEQVCRFAELGAQGPGENNDASQGESGRNVGSKKAIRQARRSTSSVGA